MQKIKIWGWDKKIRTMLRFIKAGDIFCFEFDDRSYCFGRIIAETDWGHLAEIFDYISEEPYITIESLKNFSRVMAPIVLDSYSLFDKKIVGEWRIVGHQEDYIVPDFNDIYLTFGIGNDWKKIDLYGNISKISTEEHSKYISASPVGDYIIKSLIQQHRKNVSR
jgi:hypothetical protein